MTTTENGGGRTYHFGFFVTPVAHAPKRHTLAEAIAAAARARTHHFGGTP